MAAIFQGKNFILIAATKRVGLIQVLDRMPNKIASVSNSAKMSRLGLSFSAAFALLFLACVLPASDGIYFVWFITFPFSLVCHAIGGWLQAAFGLGEQLRFVIEAALLCLAGLVEFFVIGYLMELGWRNS